MKLARGGGVSLFSGFVSITSIGCIFQSYWIAPTPSNSLFAPLPQALQVTGSFVAFSQTE